MGGTPHGLLDVLGLRSTEIDALYQDEYNLGIPVVNNEMGLEQTWKCSKLCDLVKVSTADVMAVYGQDFYEGMPTFTKNSYGKGNAYYICADFEQGFYDEVYRKIAEKANIKGPLENIPEGIEVTARYSEDYQYLFVQNFNRHTVEMMLPVEEMEVLLGNYQNASIGSLETVILKKKNKVTVNTEGMIKWQAYH